MPPCCCVRVEFQGQLSDLGWDAAAVKTVGKLLQVVALTILPLGVVMELSGVMGRAFGLNQLLILMLFGVCAFLLGRTLEGYAG